MGEGHHLWDELLESGWEYGYNPVVGKSILIGMELEVDCVGDYDNNYRNMAEMGIALKEKYGRYIAKMYNDSSLEESGIEVVFEPISAEKLIELDWNDICNIINTNPSSSNYNAGIHLHVDKAFFPNARMASVKLSYFAMKYYEEMIELGRRKRGFDYCTEVSPCYEELDDNHFQCINDAGNTFEFRFFKAIYDPRIIREYVEVVKNICECVASTGMKEFKNMSFEDIVNYESEEIL